MNIRKNKIFDPNTGQWIDAEPGVIIPDGAMLRVPMQFMDSTQRAIAEQTRNVLQDAQDRRDALYDVMCHGLDASTPFKSDAFSGADSTPDVVAVRQRRDDAYEKSCYALQDAYRANTVEVYP